MAKRDSKHEDSERSLAPISGGASEAYLEIDAAEFERARRDPAVRRLLEKADRYAESLRAQGKLKD